MSESQPHQLPGGALVAPDSITIDVRAAHLAMTPAIQAVGLLTWPATYLPITTPDYVLKNLATWWSADAIRAMIERDTTVVAEVGHRIVGTGTLGRLGSQWVIWRIYVLPIFHGTGVGARIMDALLAVIPSDEDVYIEFVAGNTRAQRFYEKYGFVPDREVAEAGGTTTVWYRRPKTILT